LKNRTFKNLKGGFSFFEALGLSAII